MLVAREPPMAFRIEQTATPSPDDMGAVLDGLIAYNHAAAAMEMMPLAVFVRDEQDRIIGGLTGRTGGGWLFIQYFWLKEALRGSGVGRELMARAEAEAVARGCKAAWVDTFEFQAPGFYRRLGYETFGVLEDYPPGSRRYFLKKTLAQGA